MDPTRDLTDCRLRFGAAPRSFPAGPGGRIPLLTKPEWLCPLEMAADPMHQIFESQDVLWRDGFVTYGAVIQANNYIWEPGPANHGGDVIFSADPASPALPKDLLAASTAIGRLKGSKGHPPALATIIDHITNEKTRLFSQPVPPLPGIATPPLTLTSVMFERAHLPHGYLHAKWMPLVVHPGPVHHATVLPKWFWPNALLDAWLGHR